MKLPRLLPYILFLILVCIFLWRPLFKGEALLPGDYLAQMSPWNTVVKPSQPAPQWNPLQWDAIAQFYPWRVFYARSMHSGHIPLWNPHQFCGTPFLANGQSAVLYPLNLVFLIFNPITAFTLFAALHLFLAQVFMYWLLRELGCKELGGIVGAICFAFSAFMVLWLELPTLISVAVWLPLVLLLIHRAVARRSVFYGLLAGAALSLSFLAGHLQIAFYVALAAMLWWLWRLGGTWRSEGRTAALRRVLRPCAAFLIVVGLMTSAQVLPSLELAANSHRSAKPTAQGYEWFMGNAIKPHRLVTAFVPDFYGNPSQNTYALGSAADYMEFGLYIGVLPLVLAVFGLGSIRRRRYAGYFGALAVFAVLVATGTAINKLFYYHIPGYSAFGGPQRVLLLYFFGVSGLAAFGVERLGEGLGGNALHRTVIALAGPLLVAVAYATCYYSAAGFVESIARSGVDLPLWNATACGLLLVSAIILCLRADSLMSERLFGVVVVSLVITDLFAFGINYNPTCSRDKVYPRTNLTDTLKRIAGTSRFAAINPAWNLYQTPKAILPPNAAMVYGLYDFQGYDSLFTRAYKDLSSDALGVDSSPQENGNMVLARRYTSRVGELVDFIVSATPIDDTTHSLRRIGGGAGGVQVYKVLGQDRAAINYDGPNSLATSLEQGPVYPGWLMIDWQGRKIERFWNLSLAMPSSAPPLKFVFEPFSFRLGLFLSLLGVAAVCCGCGCVFAQRNTKGR